MKQTCIFLFLLISKVIFSQNETNIWYFGENAGLDFNEGIPILLMDGALNTEEGCSTISDSSGNLLFYTDGITVWNRNHNVMSNGTGLNGDVSSTHSAIIVPKPNSPNIYYVFTVDEETGPNGLQYSEVDMSLDGGLGAVTTNKNILLATPITEKVTAVKSPVANEYWVVSHKWDSDEFIAYNVSETGINSTPVVSAVGTYVGGNNESIAIGQIKISPDGAKLAVARYNELSEVQLFDFDATTGVVSNPLTLLDFPTSERVYGVEFSPNSKILYTGIVGVGIYQYDLEAGLPFEVVLSQFLITPEADTYGALQLASNGKIYVAKGNRFYIDYIDNPNAIGAACNYQFEALYLDGKKSWLGLPPFIQSFFNVAFQTTNVCFGDTTQFTASLPETYDTIVWDFGDGTSSSLEAPMHSYAMPGEYEVSLTVTVSGNASTDSRTVTIYEQPTATQPQDILVCDTNNDGLYVFDLTTQDIAILNGQSATVFEVLYYASITDYNNDNPIANPTSYANATAYASQNIIASVRNRDNADCKVATDFNIQVFDSPMPSQSVLDLEFCDDTSFGTDTDGSILFDLTQNETDILNGQSASNFTVSYYTDSSLVNEITTPSNYQNTNPTETIYVQVENDDNATCVAQTSFNIEVFALPTVTAVVTLSQCDDDLDGFSSFNLNEVNDEITTNAANETITFHETQLEANDGTNAMANVTAYTNQTTSNDTIWARVENANGCHGTSQVNLFVSTTQIPLSFGRDFYQCDDFTDGNSYNGVTAFDFSMVNMEMEALFPVGQQLIINYYRNQADALAENDPIVDVANYYNVGYPNTQDIYIRVDSAVNNDCLGLGQHITLHVEPLPQATGPIIIEQCDVGNDGTEAIDTSTINDELLQGQTDVSIVFTDANGNVLPNPLPNPLVTGTQSITATMTTMNSQDPDGACSEWTTIDIIIDAGVTANAVPDLSVCDDDDDGQFAFDTSNVEATILNGQTNAIIGYRDENGNALPSPLPNPFVTTTQTMTATVENPTNPMCFAETTINFIVSSQPTANAVPNDFVCDDASNDGEHIFNLSNYDAAVLNGQSNATYIISYYGTQADADTKSNPLPDAYSSTMTSETIFARVENSLNELCYDTTSFQIGVSHQPVANQPEDMGTCDDPTNDGLESFDLSNQNTTVLNGQSEADNTVSYHVSEADAESGANALGDAFVNTANPQTLYVRVENASNANCYATTSFELEVKEQPVLGMPGQWSICEDGSVDLIADGGYDGYLWSTGESTQEITVFEAGTYTVTATNVHGDLTCETTRQITVVESNVATIATIDTVDWTQNDNVITVNVEGNGDYEYSLDGIAYQDGNQFSNLSIDDYMVHVRDKNGCGIANEEVYLLYYPSYFTPNGDGYHDTWNIYNSNKEPRNSIHIFDRYGKLLTELKPSGNGWDGTFKGKPLPTSDYWFVVKRQNGKQHTGHFALKR